LSNLTKILIVLLTISAIFLCGIVVTYVANADNYRQKYDKQHTEVGALEEKVDSLTKQLNEKTQQKDLEKTLNNKIASMKMQTDELQAKLNIADREKAELVERTNNFASVTKAFSDTAEKQTQTLNSALDDVKQLKADQIKKAKELDETSAALAEKTAIIDSLNTEKRRLVEEKADLENRLDRLLRAGGKVAAATSPVTPERGSVSAAQPGAEASAIKGRVMELDMKNSLATVSIGSADGVKQGMKFYVTRGDAFICDILITDVDTDKAVGSLELVQQPPKVGDNASTSLLAN
jgi:myosin heavy subunit